MFTHIVYFFFFTWLWLHHWLLFYPPNQTPNSCSRIIGVSKQPPGPHLQVKRTGITRTYFKTKVLARVLRMQGQSAPPHPPTRPPGAAIVWRCHTRYLTQVLPKGSGGAPPLLGCAVWLPHKGEGETGSHRRSLGATSTVNQFTWDVYLAGPPWDPP